MFERKASQLVLAAFAVTLFDACSSTGGPQGASGGAANGATSNGGLTTGGAVGGGLPTSSGGTNNSGGVTNNSGGASGAANGGTTTLGGAGGNSGSSGALTSGGAPLSSGGTAGATNTGGSSSGGKAPANGGSSSGGKTSGDAAGNAGANSGGASGSGGQGASGSGGQGGPLGPLPCEPVPAGKRLAFPGAEGFGRYALGGRGGSVCHVTTLSDSGAGSFRDCVSQGNRTVVFDVGGWITLTGNLGITVNNLTIAGQTAPGGGIGIRGTKLSIGGSNIIMRFVRVRRGIITTTDRNDAMAIASTSSNVIVDHCSVGFGTDENLSMPGDEGVGPKELTLQWSVVAWGLQRNNHSAGSLLTASNTTIHHSVYAFNGTRNPKARSEAEKPLDFVNNVIYGWNAPDPVGEGQGWSISKQPFLMADTANGMHYANAVGNYFISHGTQMATQAFVAGATNTAGTPTFNLFFDGNLLDGNGNGMLDVSKSDWSMVGTATRLNTRIAAPQVCTDTAANAYTKVLNHVGASIPSRDEVDAALVNAIRTQGGQKIQDETALGVGANGYGTLAAGTARADTDRDGMPNDWEAQRGLNPNADDGKNDPDGDGYTNLEDYLNELAAPAFRF